MYKVGTYTIKITRVDKNCNQRQWTNSRSVSAHTTSKNEHTKHAIIKSREVSLCIFLYSKIDGDMCTVCLMKKFSKKKSTYSAHISINFGTQQKKHRDTSLHCIGELFHMLIFGWCMRTKTSGFSSLPLATTFISSRALGFICTYLAHI